MRIFEINLNKLFEKSHNPYNHSNKQPQINTTPMKPTKNISLIINQPLTDRNVAQTSPHKAHHKARDQKARASHLQIRSSARNSLYCLIMPHATLCKIHTRAAPKIIPTTNLHRYIIILARASRDSLSSSWCILRGALQRIHTRSQGNIPFVSRGGGYIYVCAPFFPSQERFLDQFATRSSLQYTQCSPRESWLSRSSLCPGSVCARFFVCARL